MRQVSNVGSAGRLGSLAIIAPLALGMVGALGSTAEALELSGTVTRAKNGDPIAGTTIVAINRRSRGSKSTTTDASGNYSLTQLPAGNYYVAALDVGESHRIYHAGGTNKNPLRIDLTADSSLDFLAVGRDNTRPEIAILNPASGSALTTPPTEVNGTVSDAGDSPAPVAGVGQVAIGIATDFFFGVPTQAWNFQTRQFEPVDFNALQNGFSPSNLALSQFIRVASYHPALGTFDANLQVRDVAGNVVDIFEPGKQYAIGAGVIDKAGNSRGTLTTFTMAPAGG